MKIAYLGPVFDSTGYSKAIIESVLALDEIGVDVAVRSVKMTNTSGEVPQRIKELSKNNLQGVDCVIQHNLPSEFVYSSKCQQIGRWDYETSNFKNANWCDNLRLMDKLIVSATFAKTAVKNTDPSLDEKTYVCPHAIDTSKFDKQYDLMDFGFKNKPLKFYTVAEFGMRKNLPATIAAYYSSFCSDDSVLLVIKSHISGGDVTKMIEDICNDLKRTMHKFNDPNLYPPIAVIGSYLSDDKINSLHKSCDVFVSSSRGEAFCTLPSAEIKTIGGTKPISSFIVGDKVYSHTGQLRDVTGVISRQYDGEMINIDCVSRNKDILSLTPNHKVRAVRTSSLCNCSKKRMFDELIYNPIIDQIEHSNKNIQYNSKYNKIQLEWIEASDLKVGDHIFYPKLKSLNPPLFLNASEFIDNNKYTFKDGKIFGKTSNQFGEKYESKRLISSWDRIPINKDIMKLFGYFVAEGCTTDQGVIYFCFHAKEIEYHNEVASLMGLLGIKQAKPNVRGNSYSCKFSNIVLANMLRKLFGGYSRNRVLPEWFLSLDDELKLSFINGLFNGDASYLAKTSYDISSKKLSSQIFDILSSLGFCCSQSKRMINDRFYYKIKISNIFDHNRLMDLLNRPKEEYLIQGRNQRANLTQKDFQLVKIRSVTKSQYSGQVYNLSVSDENSYLCNDLAIHNCIPYIEALGFGNPCIVPKHSAFLDYHYDTDLMVDSTDSIVFGVQGCPPGLYTANEIWGNPSLVDLAYKMRVVYEDSEIYFQKEMVEGRKAYVQRDFSRKVVGQKLMEIISGSQDAK